MPATGRATRRHIVESSYRLFYRAGFQRSGMDAIAEAVAHALTQPDVPGREAPPGVT
jgi:AcrR family transcriptional regulator